MAVSRRGMPDGSRRLGPRKASARSRVSNRPILSALNRNWQRRRVGVAAAGQGFVRVEIFSALG